jgi:plastocyanin
MRPSLVIAITVVMLASIGSLFFLRKSSTPVPVNHAEVVLTSKGFVPNEITLKRGGTVTFSTDAGKTFWPASDLHPDHGLYPEFDPRKPLSNDETWTFTFPVQGRWGFHDHIRSYFTGIIYVVE